MELLPIIGTSYSLPADLKSRYNHDITNALSLYFVYMAEIPDLRLYAKKSNIMKFTLQLKLKVSGNVAWTLPLANISSHPLAVF